jgi:WD40 repeat protein
LPLLLPNWRSAAATTLLSASSLSPFPSAVMAVGRSDGSVYIIQETNRLPYAYEITSNLLLSGAVRSVALSNDGVSLLAISEDNQANLWAKADGIQASKPYNVSGVSGVSLDWSERYQEFAIGLSDSTVNIYNLTP